MIDPDSLVNRVLKNQRQLRKWAHREGIEAYRLYDRDIPEFPLAIDRYADWLHVQVFEKKRPLTDGDLGDIRTRLSEAFEIPSGQVVLKHRRRQRGADQYEKLAADAPAFLVAERGLRFEVNLQAYLDTGLFLDHRNTRQMIGDRARDRDFLNLFAYTGSFTAYAAAGGARRCVTVDMSRTYQAWSLRNLAHNGLEDPRRHEFVQADVAEYLEHARLAGERFDLVMLDPPSFSNSKRMDGTFDVQRDQLGLIRAALKLLAPEGELYFSNNRRGFRLDPAVSDLAEVREISEATLPPDFKRHSPHRCWVLRMA